MINIINQIFEIQNKAVSNNLDQFDRNFRRINSEFEEIGYTIVNPIGQKYSETATDIEANISNPLTAKSKIVKVLKPIIYKDNNGNNEVVQKGIVIVE